MKKLFFLLTLFTSYSIHAIEPFKEGYYVSLQAGPNFKYTQLDHNEHVKTNVGGMGSVAIGMRNTLNTRYELEFAYRYNTMRKYNGQSISGHADSQAYMFNLVYDFPTMYYLKPYIGIGGGYARQIFNGNLKQPIEVATNKLRKHTNTFAWQAIVGFSSAIESLGSNVEGTVEYRYFNPRIKSSKDQSIALGLRTYF